MSVTPLVHRLANGARLVVLPMPHLRTASVSAYLHVGSAHESKRLNGIGHVVEHMVFKGTATRDARKVNLDAEMLGAEVNAHTDKDHTAFHLRGLAVHAEAFLHQLGDLIGAPAFPDDELERERQVLLQEYAEVEDDPLDAVFQGFDRACWGTHAGAQPIIGTRRNIERFSAADLHAHARTHFTGANLVVGVAGGVDPDAMVRAAELAFGALPAGETAPLLFTSLGNLTWSVDLRQAMASLPVTIYAYAGSPYEDWIALAWTGALIITAGVLLLNVVARVALRKR